jgi:prevent-host-death family protein
MKGTISIGELRQNPTRMLREVKAGATYTITDHGEPVAEVAGLHGPRWIRGSEFNQLKRELGSNSEWARDIADVRAAEDFLDPWERDT